METKRLRAILREYLGNNVKLIIQEGDSVRNMDGQLEFMKEDFIPVHVCGYSKPVYMVGGFCFDIDDVINIMLLSVRNMSDNLTITVRHY